MHRDILNLGCLFIIIIILQKPVCSFRPLPQKCTRKCQFLFYGKNVW